MAIETIKFSDNGDSQTLQCRAVDLYIGTENHLEFGGGTLTFYARCNPNHEWCPAEGITASGFRKTESVNGFEFKLTLSGATSPDLWVNVNTDE